MSSANRGTLRNAQDLYGTPHYATHRLLEDPDIDLPGGRWLEPGAGHGDIIVATNMCRGDIVWSGAEIQPELEETLDSLCPGGLCMGDFLAMPDDYFGAERFEVALGNPPYSLAFEFVQKCMRVAKRTALLLRLSFWESEERQSFLRAYPPDTYTLPQRPCFALNKHGKVATDSTAYAWFVFAGFEEYALTQPKAGRIKSLGLTPKEERTAWNRKLKAWAQEGRLSSQLRSSEVSEPVVPLIP